MFASTAVILAALAPAAFASVFTTAPVASTSWAAGQSQTISWQDSGDAPSLADFGDAKISIYTGNANQQTLLQELSPSTNVATTASLVFTPDASIGPSTDNYFIRFESLALKDTTNPQYPALAFSAMFSLSGMTGVFNQTVQAEVDGQSTAPVGGSSTSAAASSTHAATTSAVHTTSAASTAAAATLKANATSAATPQFMAGSTIFLGAALAALQAAL